MTTSNSHLDEMALLRTAERLRARIDAGVASRPERARYRRLVGHLERRLGVARGTEQREEAA